MVRNDVNAGSKITTYLQPVDLALCERYFADKISQILHLNSLYVNIFMQTKYTHTYFYLIPGDVVTIYLETCFKKSSLVNFFLNGSLVYRQWVDVSKKHLYPTIGVSKGPARLYVIWPGQARRSSAQCYFDKVSSALVFLIISILLSSLIYG